MKPERTASPSIYIVLSTFEGAQHVCEQVESIFAQTRRDWRLLVRDDGSTDETMRQLGALAARDDRVEILQDQLGHLGINGSFSLLLETALSRGADWVAISDQDDVWKPEKLARQIAMLDDLDARPEESVLLHSDLAVVGSALEPVHSSLHRSMKLRHEEHSPLATLLVQNFVSGCTSVVSQGLLRNALPIPVEAIVYDWWLALCASSYGRLVFDCESTVLYRQHSGNRIGVKPYPRTLMRLAARTLMPRRHSIDEFMDTIRQACRLERHLDQLLAESGRAVVGGVVNSKSLNEAHEFASDYVAVYSKGVSRFRRLRELSRLRVRRQDPILNAALKLKLLFTPVELPRHLDGSDPVVHTMRRHAGTW